MMGTEHEPEDQPMSEELRYGPVELWVIPNGEPGQLWSPKVFNSKADAERHQKKVWGGFWTKYRREPRRMLVEVTARPDRSRTAGGPDAKS